MESEEYKPLTLLSTVMQYIIFEFQRNSVNMNRSAKCVIVVMRNNGIQLFYAISVPFISWYWNEMVSTSNVHLLIDELLIHNANDSQHTQWIIIVMWNALVLRAHMVIVYSMDVLQLLIQNRYIYICKYIYNMRFLYLCAFWFFFPSLL